MADLVFFRQIAENAGLARIVLSPSPAQAGAHLWVAQARAHPRLMELINAGTPPPPTPSHPATASMRARAASAVMVAGKAPMPSTVPTWGYERDVPPPACPPSSSSRRPSHGPSAYAYVHPAAQGPSAVAYPPGFAPSGYPAAPQHQHLAPYYPGQHYAQGAGAVQYVHPHAYHHAASPPAAPVPHPSFVGAQGQARRNAPGGRRMTAA